MVKKFIEKTKAKVLPLTIMTMLILASITGVFLSYSEPVQAQHVRYLIHNPYEDVNWDTVNRYRADFHTHTTRSDGTTNVSDFLDIFINTGNFSILSITDHDTLTTTQPTWPWTDYISETPSIIWTSDLVTGSPDNQTAAFYPDLGYDGVLAIKGNENTQWQHIINLMTNYGTSGGTATTTVLNNIQAQGGIAHMCHPWAHHNYGKNVCPETFYLPLYNTYYPMLNSMEASQANRSDGWAGASGEYHTYWWDGVNLLRNPDELIWGVGVSDLHYLGDDNAGEFKHYSMMLMNELTLEEYISSRENGSFYFCHQPMAAVNSSCEYYGKIRTPVITNIEISDNSITISGTDYDKIVWYNGSYTGSISDHTYKAANMTEGNTFDFTEWDIEGLNFIRAKLVNEHGFTFTQPFGILGTEELLGFVSIGGVNDGESIQTTTPTIQWYNQTEAYYYQLQIATDSDFNEIEVNLADINEVNYPLHYSEHEGIVSFDLPVSLSYGTTYYFRVKAYMGEEI